MDSICKEMQVTRFILDVKFIVWVSVLLTLALFCPSKNGFGLSINFQINGKSLIVFGSCNFNYNANIL